MHLAWLRPFSLCFLGTAPVLALSAPEAWGGSSAATQGGEAAGPRRVEAPIVSVTLSQRGALVRRRGVIQGAGSYLLGPLPAAVDGRVVTLRLAGGEVGALELGLPTKRTAAPARVEALRAEQLELEAQAESASRAQSREDVLKQAIVERLLRPADPSDIELGFEGRLEWSAARLEALDAARATREAERAALEQRLSAIDKQLVSLPQLEGRELEFSAFPASDEPTEFWLEYPLSDAGWTPLYDLRASGVDASGEAARLELVTRAEIRQTTGEDWSQVRLELTTATPQRGAQRPVMKRLLAQILDPASLGKSLQGLGYLSDEAPSAAVRSAVPAPPMASLETDRPIEVWSLPGSLDIPSRTTPSAVLVTRQELSLEVEHYAAPALDSGVWRTGRARYQGPGTLLAGPASIYLGGDFMGRADLAEIHTGEEIELPLGLDPLLSVERVSLVDRTQAPGLFGSRARQELRWRIALKNGRAAAVRVLVQESLPIAGDSRIEIELSRGTPARIEDPRFLEQREERGVLTFPVEVPAQGAAQLEWGYALSYPERMSLYLYPKG